MATLTFNGETFTVDYAVKGADFIHGYDTDGTGIIFFDGISDFSAFGYDESYLEPSECFQEYSNLLRHHEGALKRSDGETLTAADIGMAAANHTHTPESIGAAAADHSHTPASIGAASASIALTADLSTAAWNSGAKTLTVSLEQNVTGKNLVVSPAPASFEAWCESGVRATAQNATNLTFTCTDVPETDLTANILIVG